MNRSRPFQPPLQTPCWLANRRDKRSPLFTLLVLIILAIGLAALLHVMGYLWKEPKPKFQNDGAMPIRMDEAQELPQVFRL